MSEQEEFPKSRQEDIPMLKAVPPADEQKRLVTFFSDLESKQPDFLDDAAKSLIERIATFLAVLFAVTAFGSGFPPAYLKGNPTAKILVVLTLILYLAALGASLWAIQPQTYKYGSQNLSSMRKQLDKMLAHKKTWLRWAGIFFALGTLVLAALIVSIIWTV